MPWHDRLARCCCREFSTSLAHNHRHGIFVYRSPLRKVDTSSNQLCASLDKVCAAGKLLSFRLAGTCTGCGQSTAGGVDLEAHPLNVIRQRTDTSESFITLLPRLDERLVLHSFFLTILLLKLLRAGCVVLPQGGNVLAVERGGVLVATNKKGGTEK